MCNHALRRFLPLLLALLLLLPSLAACGEKGESAPSALSDDGTPDLTPTEDDLRVVLTLDGHEITYDVFRYFFLNFKAQYDGGDNTVWSDPEIGESLRAAHTETVLNTLRRIVAVEELAEHAGLSTDTVNDKVSAYVLDVFSESENNVDKYKQNLADKYLTDHALRVITASNELEEALYYKLSDTDIIDTSDDAARAAIEGEDFICVKQILIQNDEGEDTAENYRLAEAALARVEAGENFDTLVRALSDDQATKNLGAGYYFTHYQYLEEFEEAAFALQVGQTSGIVETEVGYSIIKRLDKDAAYIDDNFGDLRDAYLASAYYGAIEDKAAALPAPVYGEIYSLLTMENVK